MICVPHQLIWAVVILVCLWAVVRTAKDWNNKELDVGVIDYVAFLISFVFSAVAAIYIIIVIASIMKHFFTIC